MTTPRGKSTVPSAVGPFTVYGRARFGGHRLHFGRWDDLSTAERQMIEVANTDNIDEIEAVWVEDIGGDCVRGVGRGIVRP